MEIQNRLVRLKTVIELVSLSKSHLYYRIKRGEFEGWSESPRLASLRYPRLDRSAKRE